MRNVLKFVIALIVTILLMLIIRAYAFTVFTVTDSALAPTLQSGDRIVVKRFGYAPLRDGEMVVFYNNSSPAIGKIVAIPGDTIAIDSVSYVIPQHCKCCEEGCSCCKLYYVNTGTHDILIRLSNVMGTAHRLFPFDRQ